jgi:hypothetical protein
LLSSAGDFSSKSDSLVAPQKPGDMVTGPVYIGKSLPSLAEFAHTDFLLPLALLPLEQTSAIVLIMPPATYVSASSVSLGDPKKLPRRVNFCNQRGFASYNVAKIKCV